MTRYVTPAIIAGVLLAIAVVIILALATGPVCAASKTPKPTSTSKINKTTHINIDCD